MANDLASVLEIAAGNLLEPESAAQIGKLLHETDGAARFAEILPHLLKPNDVSVLYGPHQKLWDGIGQFYHRSNRQYEASLIFWGLYTQLLRHQQSENCRVHKGLPLFWFALCHDALGNKAIAKRYLMLTLCEDAIKDKGTINLADSGSYYRLVWYFGLTDKQLNNYIAEVWRMYSPDDQAYFWPEWSLQHLDQDWMIEAPNETETGIYIINSLYSGWLLSNTTDRGGKYLEYLAQYLIGAMPGCRTLRRVISNVSDYDVIGIFEGTYMDFRSELGRYFLVECKDWKDPADFTTVAKFCRVLDAAKCRFGILFSRLGVSGAKDSRFASREILKIFQDRGSVIAVIDRADLDTVIQGANFLTMLRSKYETVRLDLRGQLSTRGKKSRKSKKM